MICAWDDEEDLYTHLGHAATNIGLMLWALVRGKLTSDDLQDAATNGTRRQNRKRRQFPQRRVRHQSSVSEAPSTSNGTQGPKLEPVEAAEYQKMLRASGFKTDPGSFPQGRGSGVHLGILDEECPLTGGSYSGTKLPGQSIARAGGYGRNQRRGSMWEAEDGRLARAGPIDKAPIERGALRGLLSRAFVRQDWNGVIIRLSVG
jgi:hypothetical protein